MTAEPFPLPGTPVKTPADFFVLRLYVTGMTARSMTAIAVARALFDKELAGRYVFEIVDLLVHPELAEEKQIQATPTLVRELPLPVKWLVGDLTRPERVGLVLK